jgi:very-short-patch-repair endonuclease
MCAELGVRTRAKSSQTAMETPRSWRYLIRMSAHTGDPDAAPGRNTAHGRDAAAADFGYFTPGEPRIARRAASQHGTAARRQLLEDGVPAWSIDSRVRSGRLRVVHRGVYEVRGLTTSHTSYMAAVLACGDRAVLCGSSAAALWSLPAEPHAPEVLVAAAHRRVPGVRTHRVPAFVAAETTTLHGIRITTPARTLLDLARVLSPRGLEQATATALRAGIVSTAELHALLELRPRHLGARALRTLLECDAEPAFTRSPLEDRLLALIDHVGLPRPRANVWIAGIQVDFVWPDHKLVVEMDGRKYHDTELAWHTDRERDRLLVARGYRVMRMTEKLLRKDPVTAMVRLTQALYAPAS